MRKLEKSVKMQLDRGDCTAKQEGPGPSIMASPSAPPHRRCRQQDTFLRNMATERVQLQVSKVTPRT